MTGIVILAAGASTRMGQPKQQLAFENQSLLQRAVQAALNSTASTVIVVLGANSAAIRPEIEKEDVLVQVNDNWQEGMASSIRSGVNRLLAVHPDVENILFMLCDQPFVNSSLLNQLIQIQQETQSGIVACAYQNTIGAPVLFNRNYVEDLLTLSGQEGAKKLLMKYQNQVVTISFEQGGVDIDTPEDYERLKKPNP